MPAISPAGAGLKVQIFPGRPSSHPKDAIEIDVGAALPVAFAGLRRLLQGLEAHAAQVVQRARARSPAEWSWLFPGSSLVGRPLSELANAPNERRLYRESEQTFRALNFGARLILEVIEDLQRPLVLRNLGACDLVTLRGLMHTVECGRLRGTTQSLVLGEWSVAPPHPATPFLGKNADYRKKILGRMRADVESNAQDPDFRTASFADNDPSIEHRYLRATLDEGRSIEERLAAALLAIRSCFFSTNHEGALLAAETGLQLLASPTTSVREAELAAAWDQLDDPIHDIPLIEIDRSSLGDADQLRALLRRQMGVVHVFTGELSQALSEFQRGLEYKISPEHQADLHMYRALTLTKRMGHISQARTEIEAGLAALKDRPRDVAALHQGWLRNLYALTYFQQRNFEGAREQENLALAAVNHLPGPSASHLKTNVVSNFSVLFEAKGDFETAIRIWRSFEGISQAGGDNMLKGLHYRLASLLASNKQPDQAFESYQVSLEKAEVTGDKFHGEMIASGLARLRLEAGDTERARDGYQRAADLAREIGDGLRMAEDLAGVAVATGATDLSESKRCLECDSTYPLDGRLAQAVLSGSVDAVRGALSFPRSKLTRPFDLINLL